MILSKKMVLIFLFSLNEKPFFLTIIKSNFLDWQIPKYENNKIIVLGDSIHPMCPFKGNINIERAQRFAFLNLMLTF